MIDPDILEGFENLLAIYFDSLNEIHLFDVLLNETVYNFG